MWSGWCTLVLIFLLFLYCVITAIKLDKEERRNGTRK